MGWDTPRGSCSQAVGLGPWGVTWTWGLPPSPPPQSVGSARARSQRCLPQAQWKQRPGPGSCKIFTPSRVPAPASDLLWRRPHSHGCRGDAASAGGHQGSWGRSLEDTEGLLGAAGPMRQCSSPSGDVSTIRISGEENVSGSEPEGREKKALKATQPDGRDIRCGARAAAWCSIN